MRRKWPRLGWPLAIVVTAVLTFFASASLFDRLQSDPDLQSGSVHSVALNEKREYLVHLPDSYATSPHRKYPVVYVLDGLSQSSHTATSATVLSRIGEFPEAIVVGIPNSSGEGRNRDYTPPGMRQDVDDPHSPFGQADRFLDFLRRELIPTVEARYRTSGLRILAGNSRGGLFVVYALTIDPRRFFAFHAHSPALWRDDGAILKRLDAALRANPALVARLFLSLGSAENQKMTKAFDRAVALLRRQAPPGLAWRAVVSNGGTHQDNAQRSTPRALQWTANLMPRNKQVL